MNILAKSLIISFMLIVVTIDIYSQTILQMQKENGVFVMPCKVNGLRLRFIIDTGASDVSISLAEAIFMVKNGYMSENDIIGSTYYKIANGEITKGTKIILRTIEVGELKLTNVQASIQHNLDAPLLLGQSALSKLGAFQLDYSKNTLTIVNGSKSSYSTNKNPTKSHDSKIDEDAIILTATDVPLRSQPNVNGEIIMQLNNGDNITLIEEENSNYLKVEANGRVGYLSKGFAVYGSKSHSNYSTNSSYSTNINPSKSPDPHNHDSKIYKGAIKLTSSDIPLRSQPSPDAKIIIQLNKGDDISVIEDVNSVYLKVKANGQVGYISKGFVQ